MKTKINSLLVVLILICSGWISLAYAEIVPVLPFKHYWIPISADSAQLMKTPFTAIDKDSTYQLTVTRALPSPYKTKFCLNGTCVQNSIVMDTIPANTQKELQLRIYSEDITPDQEIQLRFILGPLEDSSKSAIGTVHVYPVEKKNIIFKIDSKDVMVNDEKENMDVGPVIVQGRTYVPFRFLSTVFGAQVTYTMDPTTKLVDTVTYKLGSFSLTLTIGDTNYQVEIQGEKQTKTSDGKPFIAKGRTLVPLRLISEALYSLVEWNNADRTVHIKFPMECDSETCQDIFYRNITAEELKSRIESAEPLTIIDLRVKSDYDKAHIPGAINIHISSLKEEILKKKEINADTPIVIYCATGAQSLIGSETLINLEFKRVCNLELGFTKWKYDVEKTE